MKLDGLKEDQLVALRHALRASLRWTPFDFIKGEDAFASAEREQITQAWTRPLAPEDDFRLMDPSGETIVLGERLAWDSRFFGYDIVRLNGILVPSKHDPAGCLRAWLGHVRDRGIPYVLALVFPEDLPLVQALGACGFKLIEVRVTYHEKIGKVCCEERYPVRMAGERDVALLSETARMMINPFDRFHADPVLSGGGAARMMAEWVKSSIERGFADFVLVPDVVHPKAFCTVKTHQEHWKTWGVSLAQSVVLGAVASEFRGWYRKLISEANWRLAELGAERVFWKTQLANRAAVRTAEKLGYRLGRGEMVFGLSP